MDTSLIKRVLVTEKGTKLAALNQYFLEVATSATKPQIRLAVEAKFGVHVVSVRTANMKGGLRALRGSRLQKTEATWKRAIVTVQPGERIETV